MQVGVKPGSGFRMPDGTWLNGLANGQNRSVQGGFTAHAGGTKAAALQLPAGVSLLSVDTVATNADSVLAPQAKAGVTMCIFNNGAATLDVYGQGTDTINGAATATAYALTAGQAALFFCVADGAWAAIKTA